LPQWQVPLLPLADAGTQWAPRRPRPPTGWPVRL